MPVTIAIIGPRASGKTTVARALSLATGLATADTDAMVSALHGPIREQFAKDGEAVFREREEQALREALARGGVVSCGGGIVTRRTNRLLLATVHTVFLSAPIETLVARFLADPCTAEQRPPLFADAPDNREEAAREETRRVLLARLPLYRSCCRQEIDTGSLDVASVVTAITSRLPGRPSP
ncbi:MAG: shikimate kinase [Planctomycetes bacterium]|jgi:shikimate kinase|nr:shikimate kinase [Planctomycetota bacterium]